MLVDSEANKSTLPVSRYGNIRQQGPLYSNRNAILFNIPVSGEPQQIVPIKVDLHKASLPVFAYLPLT